jgi:hypothetical protein
MLNRKMSRRSVVGFAALSLAPQVGAADDPPAIRDLHLPPELRQDLEQRAQRALQEAHWLEELPLDGVDPGFVFHVR